MTTIINPTTFSLKPPSKPYSTPDTIYATFTLQTGTAYIKPFNLSSQGYFLVSQPSSTMTISFVCNDPYTNVIGTMSVDNSLGFNVSKPTTNSVEFEVSGITDYLFATMTLMVSKG